MGADVGADVVGAREGDDWVPTASATIASGANLSRTRPLSARTASTAASAPVHGSRDISGSAFASARVRPRGVRVVAEKVGESSGGIVRRRLGEERRRLALGGDVAAGGGRVGGAEGEEKGVLRVAPREVRVGVC